MIKTFSQDFEKAITDLKLHDQICLIYDNQQDQFHVVARFIDAGFSLNEKCIYIYDENQYDDIMQQLSHQGIDAASAIVSGALEIVCKKDLAGNRNRQTPDEMVHFLSSHCKKMAKEGFTALRILEEMTWLLDQQITTSDLLQYETQLNSFYKKHSASGLYQFNRQRFNPEPLKDVLKTHRLVIYQENIYSNAFYISPENYNTDQQAAYEVESLLSGLKDLKKWENDFVSTIKDLRYLVEVNKAISGTLDLDELGEDMLDSIINHLNARAAAILMLDSNNKFLRYHSARGFLDNRRIVDTQLTLADSMVGQAIINNQSIIMPEIQKSDRWPEGAALVEEDGFDAYYALLLISREKIIGVLEVYLKTSSLNQQNWLPFLETLANQLATTLDNAQTFSNLQKKIVELTLAYDGTIARLAHAMELHDHTISQYTQSVAEMTEKLASAMGANEEALTHIRRGVLLHYISKLSLPDKILQKPGPLTDQEWEIIRQLPKMAYEMFSDIELLQPALDIPYCHHERWDGSGYPRGLVGEAIPLAARQFAIVDVYHALLTERPYRPPWDKIDVIEYIHSLSGKHFDPDVVRAFIEMIEKKA